MSLNLLFIFDSSDDGRPHEEAESCGQGNQQSGRMIN